MQERCEVPRVCPTPSRGHPLCQQNSQYPGRRHDALHFLSQLVDEVAGTITWASQPSQQHFSKRIPNFRPSVTRLALNLCEGALPQLGFQSSQARKMKAGPPMRNTSRELQPSHWLFSKIQVSSSPNESVQ